MLHASRSTWLPPARTGTGRWRCTSGTLNSALRCCTTWRTWRYIQHARKPNAYAAGRRSVAVTSRVLEDYRAGRLSEDQLVAVMVHELGHHVTRATRPMLFALWLAAPWRVAARLVIRLGNALSGRQSRYGLMVVFAGVALAVARALYEGQWLVGGVLLFVGLSAVLCPLADAAVSRRAEFAADRFAADHGLALELAAALHALDDGRSKTSGWSRRLVASHPTSDQRISALLRATVDSHVEHEGAVDVRPSASCPAD